MEPENQATLCSNLKDVLKEKTDEFKAGTIVGVRTIFNVIVFLSSKFHGWGQKQFHPYKDTVYTTGLLKQLIDLAIACPETSQQVTELKCCTLSAIWNYGETTLHRKRLVECGALGLCISMLQSSKLNLQQTAAGIMLLLSGLDECRVEAVEKGCVPALIGLAKEEIRCKRESDQTLQCCFGSLQKLALNKKAALNMLTGSDILSVIMDVLDIDLAGNRQSVWYMQYRAALALANLSLVEENIAIVDKHKGFDALNAWVEASNVKVIAKEDEHHVYSTLTPFLGPCFSHIPQVQTLGAYCAAVLALNKNHHSILNTKDWIQVILDLAASQTGATRTYGLLAAKHLTFKSIKAARLSLSWTCVMVVAENKNKFESELSKLPREVLARVQLMHDFVLNADK
mmetsp:Transcript_1380/g.1559  ORF Transcript_1380/g.1559 Transcript_1380/m.1559 type:complete len:399 (-) Transcript_1380:174-1370(-)